MMLHEKLASYQLILASQSPRRQYLLKELGLEFESKLKQMVEETFPEHLQKEEIPLFLAEKKALVFLPDLSDNTIVITADTIVWHQNNLVQKPKSKSEAIQMLKDLSGSTHHVYTGVCLLSREKQRLFHAGTEVLFKQLTDEEIEYYVSHYKPYDKAGAYGVQEWIGYIGVEHINGSFYNVMGLPVQHLYKELQDFIR